MTEFFSQTTIAPWLAVQDGALALTFYKTAFGAVEKYRLDSPDGIIAQLSISGADFWISGNNSATETVAQALSGNIRMILTVSDPDAFFAKAIKAGATEVFPVEVAHGWRLGRLVDPFGLHWEIGHPV